MSRSACAFSLPLMIFFGSASTSCIKSILINGQIQGTREGSRAFDKIDDFELADSAAASAIVQFEGMHFLAPGNTDALFLLVKGWTGYAYGFAEDELERAEDDGRREDADHHRRRAIGAYDHAIRYGLALIAERAKGFEEVKRADPMLRAWLDKSFAQKDDAETLFWLGYAWLARANLMKDDAEAIAELFVGVAMIERSVAIDPDYNHSSGLSVLAAYHARAAMAELDDAKKLFDEVLVKTQRKSLIVQFNYATRYACARADNGLYTKLLKEVLTAEDGVEDLRLTNTVARRRAKRWLSEKRMLDACGMDPIPVDAAG